MQKSIVSVALFLIVFAQSSWAQLEVSPKIRWKTLTTPHFEVIYNAEQQALGKIYAEKLEKAYFELRLLFPSMREKTVVVINDKTDVTNGYATRIPYPHIMAYPVLPGPEESLADIGDWAFELLAHEYTHILNFEPAGGVMRPLRGVFGNIIAPNLLLPLWWKEGLAVEMETRLSAKGRLRSYYQDATVRAMVEKETFADFTIAQANEQIPTWPEGMRPYLFGSLMWSQMIADTSPEVVGKLNERQGRRAPYFIEAPAREYLGQDYSSAYRKMQADVTARAQKQIQTIRAGHATPVILPKNSFISVSAPAISPDGHHLALIVEDDANKRSIKIISKSKEGESFLEAKSSDTVEKFDEAFSRDIVRDGPPTGGIQRLSWFPNSAKLVYDKIDYTDRIQRFSDLWTYDLKNQKVERLTNGLRAREPAVSADGKKIVYVQLEGGRTHLAVLDLSVSPVKKEVLLTGEWQDRISYPVFWDADTVLYSIRHQGNDELYRYSLSSKSLQKLFPQYRDIRFVKPTSEGLIFASGANGVLNLYLADKNLNNVRPVSNTTTALFTADIDPLKKEIFATQMTEQGLRVVALLPKDWQKTPAALPVLTPMMADRYTAPDTSKTDAEAQQAMQSAEESDYSPYGYLWPQYWMPFVSGSTTSAGVIFSAQTSGFDPLKKHSYSLLGTWDTGIEQGSVDLTYMNQTTSLPFYLVGYNRSSYLGTVDYKIKDLAGTLATLPDVFWISKYATLQVGWQYVQRESPVTTVMRMGPYFMYNHSNYSKSGSQISPESGSGFYLGAYDYIEKEGYLNHSQFLGGGELYLSKYLPKNHSVMLKINGAYTPEEISSIYGVSTDSVVFIPDSPLPDYLLRGYARGQIFGRNLVAATAEYRFPIATIYRGSGTDPIFIRRFAGALVTDAVAADGRFYNEEANAYEVVDMKRTFVSSGAEVKVETTLGYVLPVSFVFGYYAAFNQPQGIENSFGMSLQIVGF